MKRGSPARVRVIHWRASEATTLLDECRKTGLEVEYLDGDGGAICRAIRINPPDVVVIDLSRLPAHGREIAVWLRNTKSTRGVPLVFAGGDPVKVAAIRKLLPDATFCENGKVASAVTRLMKRAGKASPVVPPTMMERFRERSAAQKLGIADGAKVAVIDPPRDFPGLLGALPESVEFEEDNAPLTLWFVHSRDALLGSLRDMRTAASETKLWLVWPKGGSADGLTQNLLRESAREVGLVDYKICSVNERWSGMLFARKKV